MSTSNTGNTTHDNNINKAEGSRQSGISTTSQTVTTSAEIVFYRSALASALANNCSPSCFVRALQQLGTGGS